MKRYQYHVSANNLLTPSIRSVQLVPAPEEKPLLFEPGQYAAISLHDGTRPTTNRCFSLVSAPLDQQRIEFAVRVGGDFTGAFERLQAGDRVMVQGPYGDFTLHNGIHDSYVFLAAGIGITPFMSMIRYITQLQLPTKVHLIYSCRSADDIPFLTELLAAQSQHQNVRLSFFLQHRDLSYAPEVEVVRGRISSAALAALGVDRAHSQFMICGPAGYIAAVQQMLRELKVDESKIKHESFSPGSQPSNSALVRWPLHTYASAGLLTILAGVAVVGGDILRTVPALAEENDFAKQTAPVEQALLVDDRLPSLAAIPPQVDTNITPPPVEKHVTVEKKVAVRSAASAPKSSHVVTRSPAPTPQPVIKSEPAPAPKVSKPAPQPEPVVTTKPTTRTRTRTS